MNYPNGIKSIEDIDISILLRAASFYNAALKSHIQGDTPLAEDTIKFYTDRLLEINLTLEAVANYVYDSLSDEDKDKLLKMEQYRNRHLFTSDDGGRLHVKDVATIKNCIEASRKHYEEVRRIANEKIETGTSSTSKSNDMS